MKTKCSRIEISGFRFTDKKVAESEAEKIINERKSRITEAKKTWLECVAVVKTKEDAVTLQEKEIVNLNQQIFQKNAILKEQNESETPDAELVKLTEEEVRNINADIERKTVKVKELKIDLVFADDKAEAERKIKVKRIRKLNIKAYQLLPVKCIGKRGGNWIFQSEN